MHAQYNMNFCAQKNNIFDKILMFWDTYISMQVVIVHTLWMPV